MRRGKTDKVFDTGSVEAQECDGFGVDNVAKVRQVRPTSIIASHLDGIKSSGEGEDIVDS